MSAFSADWLALRTRRHTFVVITIALLYDQMRGAFTFAWGGGKVADGPYQLQLLAPGAGGVANLRAPLRVDTNGPALVAAKVVQTNKGLLITTVRVSEPGTLVVTANGKVLLTVVVGKPGLVVVRLKVASLGKLRRATFSATDALGNRTRRALTVTAHR